MSEPAEERAKEAVGRGVGLFKDRDWDGGAFRLPGGLLSSIWEETGKEIRAACRAAVEARDREWEVLEDATEELLICADLRGDADLPHPADDAKLWTARMQDAWDNLREALRALKREAGDE